jgi:hypothetical protein
VVERYGCPYIVHFEDNERAVAEAYESYGKRRKVGGAKTPPAAKPDAAADAFVRGAVGATIIVEALKKVLPVGLPCHLLEPGVDSDLFAPGLEAPNANGFAERWPCLPMHGLPFTPGTFMRRIMRTCSASTLPFTR